MSLTYARPLSTVDEMNHKIMSRWNSMVGKDGIVKFEIGETRCQTGI